jgi:hypothetical protein
MGIDSNGLQTVGNLSPMQDCMQAKFLLAAQRNDRTPKEERLTV